MPSENLIISDKVNSEEDLSNTNLQFSKNINNSNSTSNKMPTNNLKFNNISNHCNYIPNNKHYSNIVNNNNSNFINNNLKKLSSINKYNDETLTEDVNHNSKFKIDIEKINIDGNTLTSENLDTNKYNKQFSDMTLTGPVDGFSQIMRKDSKLNLSISRISLKNNFLSDNANSKLRSIYKNKNNDSILNITNVKTSDNQFIKFFTNNNIYENDKKNKDSVILNKAAIVALKDKKPAQTSKKLASDVIGIYRKNISDNIKSTNEKTEAKEIILKQTEIYRNFTNQIVKKKHIPEVDVETIMRSPVQKYAKSHFPCNKNQTLLSIASRANVTQINNNSRVLCPIGNHKTKFLDELKNEEKELEENNVNNLIRKSMMRLENSKLTLNQTVGTMLNTTNGILLTNNSIDLKNAVEEDNNNNNIENELNQNALFINKYRTLVNSIKSN